MHAIPGHEVLIPEDKITAPEKFAITFTYQGRKHATKVMVAGTDKANAFYKVVLNSYLNPTNGLCWLQQRGQDWVILLGKEIDAELVSAIASAIEQR